MLISVSFCSAGHVFGGLATQEVRRGCLSMGSPPMVTRTNITAHLLGVAASALALTVGTTALPSGPAHAADTITAADQPYFACYHLDQARAKGYTGQGVTIAILDGEVDTSAPELAGADITDKTPCTVTSSASTKQHGTNVASILVARDYGIVPQAKLLTYRITLTSAGDTSGSDCRGDLSLSKDDISSLLNTAMNDGAMIISLSLAGSSNSDSLKWAMARALSQGVIITAGAGNDAKEQTFGSFGHWSGVVGVSAIGTDGNRQDYSSWGEGVVSAAIGGPITVRDLETNQNKEAFGTSYATPLVAGSLALARQKWPQATTNQLLQLLIHTGTNPDHTWNKYTGYGGVAPGAMVNTDPSQYPDENPLAVKEGGSSPTPDEVKQYTDGVVSPFEIAYDNSYVYRGLDENKIGDSRNPYPTHLGTSPRYHGK